MTPDQGDAVGPALVLDCRGMRCPRPIIELARHIADVEVGEVIAVEADDPAAYPDILAWCRMRVQQYAGDALTPDGVRRYLVRRLG